MGAMMANTMKQIEDRKASIAALKGSSGLSTAANKVPLPAPKLLNVDAPALNPMESIAALQARINSSMKKIVGPVAPPPEKMTENEPMTPLLTDRPQAVILDDKGRTVDAAGQQITLTQYVPSLKANLRAKKRDEQNRIDKELSAPLDLGDQTKFFDGRVAIK